MNGLERQPIDSLLHRDMASRVLLLLESVDEVALDLDDTTWLGADRLSALMTRAHRRHQAFSLLARVPFGQSREERMLGPKPGISSCGAVLLAFHVGAELDGATLADLMTMSVEDVGRALYEVRMALIGSDVVACRHVQALIGRYADSSLLQNEAITLVNHARACQSCSEVLEGFRALDDRISGEVARSPVIRPADSSQRRALIGNPLLLWVPIFVVGFVAIATLGVLGFGSNAQSGPSPLFSIDQPAAEHRGWVIASSEHEVIAFDLDTGERRRILEDPAHDWWNPWIISPNAELIVRWEEYSRFGERLGAIRAYDMQGERQYLHRWRGPRARNFSGWLDDRTVLFVERGPTARADVDSEIPDEMASSVIAANLETGEEHVIVRGMFDRVVPSPDGDYLAVTRPAPAPWPGKTVDVIDLAGSQDPEIVAQLDQRYLSWSTRMIWSRDSETIYLSAIPEVDTPEQFPAAGDPAPGAYEFERLTVVGLRVDGSIEEFETTSDRQWLVPQAIDPAGETLAIAVNEDIDRDGDWSHGSLDLASGQLDHTDQSIPGSRWWNSEATWSPGGDEFLYQQVTRDRFRDGDEIDIAPLSIVLQSGADSPVIVFQDGASIRLRDGMGLGLLRWVPDDVMRPENEAGEERPRASEPQVLSQATADQQLMSDSAVGSTGRYVLLRQHDPDAGTRNRLMHVQAWGGTQSDASNTRDFSWLPREPSVIGVTHPDGEEGAGSRLVFLGTDQNSPLHGYEIDPAEIEDRRDRLYREPVFSQNGANLAFMIEDQSSGLIELWIDPWNDEPFEVTSWDVDEDARIDPTLYADWIGNDSLIFSRVTDWDDGYPRAVELVRADPGEASKPELTTIREFSARGADRGIDLGDVSPGPDRSQIAFRLRSFSGDDPDDARDSILVSPVEDLTQTIEIIRADPGDGLIWLGGEEWLVAGIDDRIALLEVTGRETEFLTQAPSAYPVLIGPGEIWYQDQSDEGQITRITFEHSVEIR